MKSKQILIAIVLGCLASLNVSAWESVASWPSNSKNMRASDVSFPLGGPYATSLDTVLDIWNLNPSPFRWTLIFGDKVVSRTNAQNETWFEAGPGPAPAETLQTYDASTDEMINADVIFYNTYTDSSGIVQSMSWTTSTTYTDEVVYGGSSNSFHSAAMHEMGHAMGLSHEDDEYNIMGDAWTHLELNVNSMYCSFGEDAADAAVGLYGLSASPPEDLAVTHWKYSGASGGYSTHERTKMYDKFGFEPIYTVDADGSKRYILAPGYAYQVELTYENLGGSSQTEDVGFYLSTNNIITIGDTFITTRTPTLNRNDVYTQIYTIKMPANVHGDFYLGALIDADGSLFETTGANNAAWFAVHFI